MGPFDIEFDDVGEFEAFLVATYAKVSIASSSGPTYATVSRRVLTAQVAVDELAYGFDYDYELDSERLLLWSGLEGGLVSTFRGEAQRLAAGDAAVVGAPGQDFGGQISRGSRYSMFAIDTGLLTRIVWGPEADERQVRFDHGAPRTPELGDAVTRAMRHAREIVAMPGLTPLVAESAAQYVGTVILEAFETDARPQPARGPADFGPRRLRRAAQYVEAHAAEPITVGDVASAAGVSARALHLAFRKHLDTTPMAYVRQVRLELARRDLLLGNGVTVAEIAMRWGFAHQGRFASRYRTVYGEAPVDTLAAARG